VFILAITVFSWGIEMTKKIMRLLLLTACFIMLFSHSAVAGVKGSKHDFSSSNVAGPTQFAGLYGPLDAGGFIDPINEVCVFCHTPHGASTNNLYKVDGNSTLLWNRVASPPANYTYAVYTSPTLTGITKGDPPTGLTLMCMSCHDGVTSIAANTLLNPPGKFTTDLIKVDTMSIDDPGAIGNSGSGAAYANIGDVYPPFSSGTINMSNDHPVGFNWPSAIPGLLASPARPELRLFGVNKRMECSTCHNVHNNVIPPFLSMANTNSDMCLACHDK